jgi:hypothetical protein
MPRRVYDSIIEAVRGDVALTDDQIWDVIVVVDAYVNALDELRHAEDRERAPLVLRTGRGDHAGEAGDDDDCRGNVHRLGPRRSIEEQAGCGSG